MRLCIVLLGLVGAGCSGEDSTPREGGGAPADVFEMELFDSTIELDGDALAALESQDEDLTLRFAPAPAALAGVERGSVLVGGASDAVPTGILRLVTGVERSGDTLAVRTIVTLPQLAFRKLKVEATRTIDPDPAYSSLRPLASGSAFPATTLDEFVFNGDGDPATTDDQVRLTGRLAAGLSYTFGLSADWSDVTGSIGEAIGCALSLFSSCDPLEVLPEIKGGFSFEAGADAEIRLDGSAFLGFSKPVVLPVVRFDPIVFGPLWFFPELEVRADIEGEASSQFEIGASAFAHAAAGLSYSSRHGGSAQAPTVTAPEFEVLAAKPGLGARARVRVGPRLAVKLYGFMGPFASVYAFAELDADRTRTPCHQLTAGLEGDMGITLALDAGFLSVGLPPFTKDFDIMSSVVSEGSCPLPAGGEPGSPTDVLANPTFTPWAATYGDTLLHFPFEDAGAQIEWTDMVPTIDGRWVVAGSAMEALVKIDSAGDLLWAKTYSLPEAWNDTLSQREVLPGRVVPTADAGMLVAAFPYTLVALDDQGDVRWGQRIDWPYREGRLQITGLVATANGGFLVTGTLAETRTVPFEEIDAFVAHLDSAGGLVKAQRLGVPGLGETARGLFPFAGGAILLGSTWDPSGAFWRAFVVRFDEGGEIVWARHLDANDGDSEVRTFLLTGYEATDGDFIAAGTAQVRSRGSTLVVKIKPDGALAWATAEDAPDSYVGVTLTGIAQLPTTGMVATGRFSLRQASDLWLAGLDSIGKVQWMKRFGRTGESGPMGTDPGAHNAPGVAVGSDGGVFVAGYTQGLASGASTEGLAVFEAYAKDGALSLSDPRATLVSTSAQAVSLTVEAVPWSPVTAPLDLPIATVEITASRLDVPVTRLSP